MAVTLENPRELRGLEILGKGNEIRRINPYTYRVSSQSGNGSYLVVGNGKEFSCECADYKFRGVACKHIFGVFFSLNLRQKVTVQNLGLQDVVREGCKVCGSSNVIKLGLRHNEHRDVQKFKCKECGHYYSDNRGFEGVKATPKAITVALDLFFKGVSHRKIVDHLKQFEGIKVSHVAVIKWIRKYTKLMASYVDQFTPQLGGMWHSDEMMINVRRTEKIDGENYSWLWNLMDHETRFLLASQISKHREIRDARNVLRQAKSVANSQTPDFIVTDKLPAYKQAITKEFYTMRKPRTEHVKLKNIREGTNNNIVERLNGTVRERLKVMRGLDHDESAQKIIDGKKLYYNYLRPHQALNGLTPAEKAGIDLKLGENRWDTLIRRSAQSNRCN
ncbi:MAG: IS1/IS6 family transposase [Thaumarchaeota archaeon]|nr:IS1/IS6 family transposase [Nitrososphaerota archaeon]